MSAPKKNPNRRIARISEEDAIRLYHASADVRRMVESKAEEYESDFKTLFREMRALPDDAAKTCPRKVTYVWGIYIGVREKIIKSVEKTGIQYRESLFHLYVFGTDSWKRFSKMHTLVYQQSAKYKAGRRKYEKERKAERSASRKKDPEYKAQKALAMRMKYYNVTDPKDLPEKSTKGRKAADKKEVAS